MARREERRELLRAGGPSVYLHPVRCWPLATIFGMVLFVAACNAASRSQPSQVGKDGGGIAEGTGGVGGRGGAGDAMDAGQATDGRRDVLGESMSPDAGVGSPDASGHVERGKADSAMPNGADGGPSAFSFDAGPITECTEASLDRFQTWRAHANVASGGGPNLLVKRGERYVARMRFPGGVWSEVVVDIANASNVPVDLSASAGFSITYSATANLWMQLRGSVQPHGGDQHVVLLPATGGGVETRTYAFSPDAWTFQPNLGKPTVALAAVLKSALFFDIVGNTANTVEISGLRLAGYSPPCR